MAADPPTRSAKDDRNRYAALAFCWADLLFELDAAGAIAFCAGPVLEFTGVRPERVTGLSFEALVAPADGPVLAGFLKAIRNQGRSEAEDLSLRRGAALLPVRISGYHLDERFLIGLRLRTGKPAAKPAPAADASGGLRDREGFSRHASRHIKELETRGERAEMTVLDVGGLTSLGETLSEPEQHRLLSSVGACLSRNSLAGDTATRLGGDAFGLLHHPSLDVSALQAQLQEAVQTAAPGAGALEIGHSTLPMDEARDVSEHDLAKGLMYAIGSFQKRSGGDFSLSSLTDNLSALINQGLTDMRDFRRVLSERSFAMALQPIIDTRNGAVHHFEALCRFDVASPEESPYRYIAFAEETGLIHEFDLAMAAKVVSWLRRMPVNNSKFSVAVNISGYSIGRPEYVQAIHHLLKANPWTTDRLMFEITESARMTDLEAANEFIQGLRRLGYRVCLDDFGAGAASFQYLSALEVDVVKIDGSAVRNAQRAPKGRAFLSALTELCSRLGVETIAEMIDSPESLRFVRDCRCDYVQGFLFGKPSRSIADFAPLPNGDLFAR